MTDAPATPAGLTDALLERASRRDVDGAVELIRQACGTGAPAVAALRALADVQRQVGQRWYDDEWTVADEHAATAVVDAALAALQLSYPGAAATRTASVVVACPEGEWHSLPARMLAAELRTSGAEVTFLGASMPAEHLRLDLGQRRPDLLALSVSTALALPATVAAIDAARAAEVPVVLGGRALGIDEHRALALGADGWARTAPHLLEQWPTVPPAAGVLEARREREQLVFAAELARPDLVERAMAALGDRFPPLAAYDARQLARTREDFDYIARFVEASVLVDDQRLFDEFLDWLSGLLAARGVPAVALTTSLESLVEVADDGPVLEVLAAVTR